MGRVKRETPEGEVSIDQEVEPSTDTNQRKIQIEDKGTTPSQFAVKQEREQLIDSLLALLEPEQRELIIQRDLEELTFTEIGELLGKTEDATRKQYCRAFKKLIELSEEKLKPIMAEETFRKFKDGF